MLWSIEIEEDIGMTGITYFKLLVSFYTPWKHKNTVA